MPKHFFKKFLPHPDSVRKNRSLRWLGPAIHDPNLWHLSRRSVAGGVAVGAFFAFMLPVAQFVAAAVAAIVLRVNLPVAMTSTLITNPFTFAPWYYLAYKIGAFLTGESGGEPTRPTAVPTTGGFWDGFVQGFDNLLNIGQPLLIGLAVLAVTGAVGGYLVVNLLWRLQAYIRLRRQRRVAQRP